MSHGTALKEYLKINKINVQAFADKVPVSLTKLYKWFNMEEFDNVTMTEVVNDGKVPAEIFKNKKEENIINDNQPNQTDDFMKDKLITSLEKTIEVLERENEGLRQQLNSKHLKAVRGHQVKEK